MNYEYKIHSVNKVDARSLALPQGEPRLRCSARAFTPTAPNQLAERVSLRAPPGMAGGRTPTTRAFPLRAFDDANPVFNANPVAAQRPAGAANRCRLREA
jgi:hypothetical protein